MSGLLSRYVFSHRSESLQDSDSGLDRGIFAAAETSAGFAVNRRRSRFVLFLFWGEISADFPQFCPETRRVT